MVDLRLLIHTSIMVDSKPLVRIWIVVVLSYVARLYGLASHFLFDTLWVYVCNRSRGSLIISGCLPAVGSLYSFGCLNIGGTLPLDGCLIHDGSLLYLVCIMRSGSLNDVGCLISIGSLRGSGSLPRCGSLMDNGCLEPLWFTKQIWLSIW